MAKLEFKFNTKKFEKNVNKALEKIIKDEQRKLDIKKTVKECVKMTLLNEVEEALRIMRECLSKNGNISTYEYDKFPNCVFSYRVYIVATAPKTLLSKFVFQI